MVPFLMIMDEKLMDGTAKRIFTKQNHLIQAAFFYCSHEAFRVCIQVRRSRRQLHEFNTYIGQHRQKFARERIPIVNEIALSFQEAVDFAGSKTARKQSGWSSYIVT